MRLQSTHPILNSPAILFHMTYKSLFYYSGCDWDYSTYCSYVTFYHATTQTNESQLAFGNLKLSNKCQVMSITNLKLFHSICVIHMKMNGYYLPRIRQLYHGWLTVILMVLSCLQMCKRDGGLSQNRIRSNPYLALFIPAQSEKNY